MREGDETQRRFSPIAIIAAIIIVAGVVIGGAAVMQMMSNNAPVNVVVLKSDGGSFKEKPAEEPDDTDAGAKSTVMTMLDELQQNKDDVEVISLAPQSPEMPEVKIDPSPEQDEAPKTQEQAQDQDQAQDQEQADKADSQEAQTEEDATKPTKRPLKPLIIENPVAKGPSMMVQLAAFRDQEKAQEVAALLTEKHKDRLQGLSLGIMQADTGSSGIFWRVTTEPLPTEDARGLCDALKRAGQDCIFRKVAVQ
ncbi:MAG: SPOR domain-containing protein [Candidatus Puniceispirillaceae bacterium]